MDMIHCEKQAKLVIEQSKGALQLIHGELIMQSYFDSLAAEVQETLQVRQHTAQKEDRLTSEAASNGGKIRLDQIESPDRSSLALMTQPVIISVLLGSGKICVDARLSPVLLCRNAA